MTYEVTPKGNTCNLKCGYCYQDPMREAGNVAQKYDLGAMLETLEHVDQDFIVFGGEPLLTPIKDLETIFEVGFRRFGRNGIQTNGTLITARHIELFVKYNVSVGISMDGPGGLNDARLVGSLGATREATTRTERAIEDLARVGRPPSLIITLHRRNAVGPSLGLLIAWIERLVKIGVKSIRLHILEVDGAEARNLKLTDKENIAALLTLMGTQQRLGIKFDIFGDMFSLLEGKADNASCIWNACDPYTTPAVHGIDSDGSVANCGRVNKDGVSHRKASVSGSERQQALYRTPQENGGCKGCRFFLMCKGECPGTAIDSDWRNRTVHCAVLKGVFEHLEGQIVAEGRTPISLYKNREEMEREFLRRIGSKDREHGDSHGDVPHGDKWFLGVAPVGRPDAAA